MNTGILLENTVKKIAIKIPRSSVKDKMYNEDEIWREIIQAILSSRVRFEIAKEFASIISKAELLQQKTYKLFSKEQYSKKIINMLNEPSLCSFRNSTIKTKYPFPNSRANYIADTFYFINGETDIGSIVYFSCGENEKRNMLIENIRGVGPKQASMIMRNLGLFGDFAVLDTHILDYLYIQGITEKRIISINNIVEYEKIEKRYCEYAKSIDVDSSILDISIWIVMRVYKQEYGYEYS